nr:hypothetical protein L204_00516 [Cryptococcus depauperatus CBS 7855]
MGVVDTSTTASKAESTVQDTKDESVGSQDLLSFEEWKRIKMEEDEQATVSQDVSSEDSVTHTSALEASSIATDIEIGSSTESPNNLPQTIADFVKVESTQPLPAATHHNKYNYASLDCSARIHSSSPQTQHASSILHKSRDRYMLTPCKAKEHWVVVELCDEIRIEAVEIAVWEFFSSVVREVRVSVGGEDEEEEAAREKDEGKSHRWKEVGSFVGKNIRGSQTFTLFQPTSFHRFIRLDFPTFFGTEYYCPVSSLKVYGMNQMEAFKWEQKKLNAAVKEKDRNGNKEKERELEELRMVERQEKEKREREEKDRQEARERELDELEKLLHEQAKRVIPDLLTESGLISSVDESVPTVTPSPVDPASLSLNSSTSSLKSDTSMNATAETLENSNSSTMRATNSSNSAIFSSTKSLEAKTATSSTSTFSRVSIPRSDSSESIYAFIVRRLNALEGNSSLVARYIEEQAKAMRFMLRRVETRWDEWKADWEGDDHGRWQQERMRQEDRLGKVISQLEQQRIAFENDRKEMQAQLRGLANELSYERRRGIAQLIAMIIIVILGVITRTTTIDNILTPLLVEARRRRNVYTRRSTSGPLTGLCIDMGDGRSPKVIGQGTQFEHNADSTSQLPSPSYTPRAKHSLSRSGSGNRPNHLGKRRALQAPFSSLRSASATDHTLSSNSSHASPISAFTNPRPRVSLPSARGLRKLARSSHLHSMDATMRDNQDQHANALHAAESAYVSDAPVGLKRRRPRISLLYNADVVSSPISSPSPKAANEKDTGMGRLEDSQGEWNTDLDTEASEVENEVVRKDMSDKANLVKIQARGKHG